MSSADINETGSVLGPNHIMQTTHTGPTVKAVRWEQSNLAEGGWGCSPLGHFYKATGLHQGRKLSSLSWYVIIKTLIWNDCESRLVQSCSLPAMMRQFTYWQVNGKSDCNKKMWTALLISFTIIQVFWPMGGTPAESEGIWLRCKMHNEKKK